RVAGTRHLELDLGRTHPHAEIELPPERTTTQDRARVAFRPTKWKLFRDGQPLVKPKQDDAAAVEPRLVAQA
ncbi:TOBE-like domain-containing protein, partial [Ensifer sp. LC54]|uniref:TOBE-like domain-containing protein n=1 Tax=unclassified Ensifer TaxID=2633371 RepID=UPI000AAA615C